MEKIILTFLILFVFSNVSTAQQVPVSDLKKSVHAGQLNKGVLLVQLPNSDKKIDKLRNAGHNKLADVEEKEIKKLREDILTGFEKEYNFSQYFFIESGAVSEILNGNFENVLNSNLEKVDHFPQGKDLYIVRHGPGNPNGEHYKYNGEGFQVRYINSGQIETIKYDTFFVGQGRIRLLRRYKNWKHYQIKELNNKLKNVKF